MREIKFRAWDKIEKIMFDIKSIHIDTYIIRNNSLTFYSLKDVETMQYTGLKDKNGVEIYEGDIVLVSDGIDSYVTDVYWGGKEYPAFDLNYKYIPSLWYYESNVLSEITNSGLEEIEVIGNIYENKEILEEK